MFVSGFYLGPFLENKNVLDEPCRDKKYDVHKINVGKINLLYCKIYSDGVMLNINSDSQQPVTLESLSLLVPLDSLAIAQSPDFSLYSNNEYLGQRWEGGSQFLLLSIPLYECSECLGKMGLSALLEDFPLASKVTLPFQVKPIIVNIINNLVYCYERSYLKLPFQNIWDQEAEFLAATFLLQHLHHSFGEHVEKYQNYLKRGNNGKKRMVGLEKLEAYLVENLSKPIGLDDMTKVSGYSRSYLNKLCLEYIGLSPMNWLRDLRLDAVDLHLKTKSRVNVTDVALLYGFGHVGRFSNYFYKRFGYLPSSVKSK